MLVRGAGAGDAGRIAEQLGQLGYPVTAEIVTERLAYWLPEPMSRVLVAESERYLVGCVSLHAIPYLERTGRWLRIESLVVDEAARGAGVGRALVRAAEEVASEWACVAVEVTSARSRAGAHAFYRKLSFTDVCDRSGRFFKELPAIS